LSASMASATHYRSERCFGYLWLFVDSHGFLLDMTRFFDGTPIRCSSRKPACEPSLPSTLVFL
jgi:hypothetical protein